MFLTKECYRCAMCGCVADFSLRHKNRANPRGFALFGLNVFTELLLSGATSAAGTDHELRDFDLAVVVTNQHLVADVEVLGHSERHDLQREVAAARNGQGPPRRRSCR